MTKKNKQKNVSIFSFGCMKSEAQSLSLCLLMQREHNYIPYAKINLTINLTTTANFAGW